MCTEHGLSLNVLVEVVDELLLEFGTIKLTIKETRWVLSILFFILFYAAVDF